MTPGGVKRFEQLSAHPESLKTKVTTVDDEDRPVRVDVQAPGIVHRLEGGFPPSPTIAIGSVRIEQKIAAKVGHDDPFVLIDSNPGGFKQLTGAESFPSKSTRRHFQRYVDRWFLKQWENKLDEVARAAVDAFDKALK